MAESTTTDIVKRLTAIIAELKTKNAGEPSDHYERAIRKCGKAIEALQQIPVPASK